MMRRDTQEPNWFAFAACATVLSCLAIGLTSLRADAEPPSDQIHRAREAAERAAATDLVLRKLGEAPADAAVATAAAALEPAPVAVVPRDWQKAGLDPSKAVVEGDAMVQTLPNGARVTLTIDPDIQAHLEAMFDEYTVAHGGVVLVEPSTGRVLAMVSDSDQEPAIEAIARKATAPSASVFKVVTAAALLESAGWDAEKTVCYHGGRSRLTERNIKGDARRDHKCTHLGDALAWSINSIMAKLAYTKLSADDLRVWSEKFGYNTDIPFELPVEVSTADIVDDPFERARLAAGFWHTYLSPLHGALIAAAVANDGVMMRPTIVERYESPAGQVLYEFEPKVFRRVMAPQTAQTLGKLLEGTAEYGTARRYFAHRRAFPDDVTVAGKTGTLSNHDPYLGFTWFVGFGRHQKIAGREAAVGGLLCNTPKWWIKGPFAASEALRKYFEVADERAELAAR